jgi:hypothetical protein
MLLLKQKFGANDCLEIPDLPFKNCVLIQSTSDSKENIIYHVWVPNCSKVQLTVVDRSIVFLSSDFILSNQEHNFR